MTEKTMEQAKELQDRIKKLQAFIKPVEKMQPDRYPQVTMNISCNNCGSESMLLKLVPGLHELICRQVKSQLEKYKQEFKEL